MSKNRLNLNFDLVDREERSEFVRQYVESDEFIRHPLTTTEINTIANYILWGRNPETGKNAVQDKLVQIDTKHGTWDASHPTESYEALLESPAFNESQI